MEPCILCPAAHGLRPSCHAREANVPRYCVLIAVGREDYRRLIAGRSGVTPIAPESAGQTWWGPVRETIPAPPPALAPAAPAVDLSLERRIVHCPHRSRPPGGCGCAGLSACAAGRGERPGLVTWAECMTCVQAGGPPATGQAGGSPPKSARHQIPSRS